MNKSTINDNDIGEALTNDQFKFVASRAKEQIKANAPVGATHFTHEPDFSVISYWRIMNGWVESWSDDDGWINYQHVKSYNDFVLSILKPL